MSTEQTGVSLHPATPISLLPSPVQYPMSNQAALGTTAQPVDARKTGDGPALQRSPEKLMAEVAKYDGDMVKNWKEDIDTLLVFAGLFFAVVIAFAIEPYQWLSEDPADTTITILTHVSKQLNASQSMFPERPQFEPDASSIRINCF
ncbi:hypothetical protein Moror_7059 [Moniliophthora roreri MCA 2997]|uniref:DUF6535 domain-containing protein n=1 Tax=Moniliophthora roreri (strain MCA 2997) TaxID=1381753 RepID=V2XAR2_MONRO|nr:hypothetical protein Moror_7059 [Moniliophthora roreri MCA 2997]